MMVWEQNRDDEAQQLCREAVTGAREALGMDHPRTQVFLRNPWGIR